MVRKGKVRKVFPGGNTSKGFVSFYDYIVKPDTKRIFVIKGGPGVGKSTFMRNIAQDMISRGFDVEYHQCSSDNNSLDGVVIPAIGVALIDGTAPHVVDPRNPGAVDEIIHLGDYWDEEKMVKNKEKILSYNKKVGRQFKIAYSLLREAKVAYDEWKSYVKESVNPASYNRILNMVLDGVFGEACGDFCRVPEERHLFASAITPEGVINYIDTLIYPNMKIYALQGQVGTGLKEMITRVAQRATELGFDTEQFHCCFEPDFLDMVIIPGLETAVLNVSGPFHYDISAMEDGGLKNSVSIINLDACVRKEILDEYDEELADAKRRFCYLVDKAIEHIARAKALHDEMEKYYIDAMDFCKVEEKRKKTLERILKYANSN